MKHLAILGCIVFVLISCNSGNKENSATNSSENNQMKSTSSDGKTYDCLREFHDHYDKLLTKEEMASVYPIDFDNAKVKLSKGNHGKHKYIWPSDRPEVAEKLSGMNIMLPDDNFMEVAMLSFYSEDSDLKSNHGTFDMGYKKLSEAELKRINENLEKQSDEVKQTGKTMMEARAKRSWDFVDGLGTSAWYKWNDLYGGELAVLAGRAKFNIRLKVSEDSAKNLEIAKKLAQKVLDKCD